MDRGNRRWVSVSEDQGPPRLRSKCGLCPPPPNFSMAERCVCPLFVYGSEVTSVTFIGLGKADPFDL